MRGEAVVATVTALAALALGGCRPNPAESCAAVAMHPGDVHACAMPGWVDRAFTLHVPASWDGTAPLKAIVLLHGGGGNRAGIDASTCPGGDAASPRCFVAAATARGYAVVIPDGTGSRPLTDVRTWNAGGGHTLACVSGGACKSGVDDVGYFDDLLDEVGGALPLDPRRLYVTGMSNGGAMTHRLACLRSARIAAIAAVSGANEYADDGGACPAQLPVLHVHGTADACWDFDGGPAACADKGGSKTSVAATMEGWRLRNGCAATYHDVARPKRVPADPTALTIRTWDGCAADTVLFRLEGAGHAWPSGWPRAVGDGHVVSPEADSDDLLDFFDGHPHA
jgi:polyhydroxybutyrate depolymerase